MVDLKPPHIIMIVADDLGFNDVSFHGSPQIPTPNIDRLAKKGIILNNYYVLPNCSPTRSAFMTGRYPIHTGMQSGTIYGADPWGVGLEEKFLPQYLKEYGYKTHAIGKWHLGFFEKEYTPTHRGFDTFFGFYGGQADYWDHSLASNGYWGLDLHRDTPTKSESVWTQWGNYSSKMFTAEAIDRIMEHDTDDPFHLYLAYQAVHSANMPTDPLQAPQAWINKFRHINNIGRRKYAAMVAYMDYGIGQVYNALKRRNMLDNSIIIFTSDNGGPANGFNMNWATNYPLRGVKTTVYEGGVRAAGCIYSPLFKNPGRVSLDLMHATDWLPTLLTVASEGTFSNFTNLDGMNFWDTFQNKKPSPRTEVLINIDPLVYKNAALRIGEWKIVNQSKSYDGWYPPPGIKKHLRKLFARNTKEDKLRFGDNPMIKCGERPLYSRVCGGKKYLPCLFNIENDPCEYEDVSNKFPIIYNIMIARLNEYRKKMHKPRRNTNSDPQANPKLHNGAWISWKDDAPTVEKSSYFNSAFQWLFAHQCHLEKY